MSRRKLTDDEVRAFTASAGWASSAGALEKTYRFPAYRDGVACAVAVAMVADQRDHHPDLAITYGKVSVRWSTHDAGGITELDRELATISDEIASRHGGSAA